LNEKLLDRIDFQQSIIEKEASAHTYMYNYPPKGGDAQEAIGGNKAGKKGAAENEGQRIKKMYEDQMEQLRKGYESAFKNMKIGMSNDIEVMTEMFSKASKDLVKLTLEHRELQAKFDTYHQKTEEYIKDREAKVAQLDKELAEVKHNFATFDENMKKKNKELERM